MCLILCSATSTLQSYKIDLSKGFVQEFTFIRPQDIPVVVEPVQTFG